MPSATATAPGQLDPDSHAGRLVAALIAREGATGADLVSLLGRHGVPPTAVESVVVLERPAAVEDEGWRARAAAGRQRAERLGRARSLTEDTLAPLTGRWALAGSALGPLWGSDVDVLVPSDSLPEALALLRAAGFLDVQPLLRRLGRTTSGVHRLAAVAEGAVLGSVELCIRLHDFAGPPADAAVARAAGEPPRLARADRLRRRCAKAAAARGARLRDVLELAALLEDGGEVPGEAAVAAAVRRCARLEQSLGVPGILSAHAEGLRPRPSGAWAAGRARGLTRALRRRLRPRRVTVAFSGIDGAGKTTQAGLLTETLRLLDVPAAAQWLRIGYSDAQLLPALAAFGRRLLRQESHAAMRERAAGAPSDAHPTRRGLVGWGWALLVTLQYASMARRMAREARGMVLVGDRALPDAIIGLEDGYGGSIRLGFQRRVLRLLVPSPQFTFYLRLTPELSLARKQDIFAREVLERHARFYDELLHGADGVVTLDASEPADRLARSALGVVLEEAAA